MSAKNLMSVSTGSASIRMAPIAANVPLVTSWKGMNVWVSNKAVSSTGILKIRLSYTALTLGSISTKWGRNQFHPFTHSSLSSTCPGHCVGLYSYSSERSPHGPSLHDPYSLTAKMQDMFEEGVERATS